MAQSWAYVAAGTTASGANPAPGIPAGVQVGDLLVIFGAASATSFNATPPTGWTNLTRQAAGPRLAVWYKTYATGDTAPTLTDADTTCVAVMHAWRNVGGFDAQGTVTSGSSTAPSTASGLVTTKQADDLVISAYAVVEVQAARRSET